jgi:hypothetical protein
MSYRLADVAELPGSHESLITIVHPLRAVDIVGAVLDPYQTTNDSIENLTPDIRRDELLEQISRGERLLFDASGASPGIFRQRTADPRYLIDGLPPRLVRSLEAYWNGSPKGGAASGAGVARHSDSLAPSAGAAYTPPPVTPARDNEPGLRTLDLAYYWPDGTGVAGAPYAVEGVSDTLTGKLDGQGQAHVSGLKDPVVDVRFGPPAPDGELGILRRQLQAQLDGIIQREKREASKLEAGTADLSVAENAGVHFANGFRGLWDSAVGFVTTALAVGNLNPLAYYNRAVKAAWMATLDGSDQDWVDDFKARFDESNKQALVAALGFDPDDITREQLAEAYEITSLLLDDAESRDMLGRFAVDYTQAQDSTELSYMAGGLVFETVLTIVLAAATLGPGAALSAPRHMGKLKPLGEPLRKLANRLKVKQQTRYRRSVKADGRCEATCGQRPEGFELKTRSLASRRLVVTNLKQARAALAASRRRLVARGGFTPKYTQEELTLLASRGLDDDRFIVRFIESRHVDRGGELDGQLGRAGTDGQVRYWATTLDQVEPSDTCPRLIAQQLGVEYDPGASYRLAIIDREVASRKAGARTLIPTFDNLKGFARENIDGYADRDSLLDEVMTPGYQERYRKLVEGMGEAEWESLDRRSLYLKRQGLNDIQIQEFEARMKIQTETGANEHFLGNGLTRHTGLSDENDTIFGAVETFTLEKNPQTFRAMTSGGQGGPDAYVELIDLTPIEFGD